MIKIQQLRKEFDQKVVALDSIDMIIEDKQFVALLGPSGCGKTTTLNCIAGLLDPTSGTILFDDKDVTSLPPKDRNIGMVFQSYALYPHLKVIDNIAFSLKQKGIKKEERHAKAREIAKKLQIEHLLDRKPTQLSGGQQQRVAMARALVKEPKILLLDEPMSNLDARLKIEIREVIKRIQQELQVTSIIVTHDQEEAMAIADKIAILDNGKIQQYDTPEVLYHSPINLFVANFMGNPPMNFIQATLVEEKGVLYFKGSDFLVEVSNQMVAQLKPFVTKKVKIGVRSHQISLCEDTASDKLTLHLEIAENLGKEYLLSGTIGEDHVRITLSNESVNDFSSLRDKAREKKTVSLRLSNNVNVFDEESGQNISLKVKA